MNNAIPAPKKTGSIEGGPCILPFVDVVIVAGLKLSVRIGSGPCKTAFSGILIVTPPCRTDILYYYSLDYYFYFLNNTNSKTNAPPMYIYVEVLDGVLPLFPFLGASGSLGSGL